MTTVGIVGGQLQGLEAVYLAREAGFKTLVIDKDYDVPARFLCDEFFQKDILENRNAVKALLSSVDLVLPATENFSVLKLLSEIAGQIDIPLALDLESYEISSSKIRSNKLFTEIGISIPEVWPGCDFPVIVKPSGLSGSSGVKKILNTFELDKILDKLGDEAVVQECLTGPSYSLEVIADKGNCVGLQITELNFDAGYDCKRVIAGSNFSIDLEEKFYRLGNQISEALCLSGIMDIEVIDKNGELKVLEIDARLPSQTPTAVYHSTGVNMLGLLAEYWINGRLPSYKHIPTRQQVVIYEHLAFSNGTLKILGEHILAGALDLKVYQKKFLADVFITNCNDSPGDWVATAIYTGKNEAEVWEKRNKAIQMIWREFRVKKYIDSSPFNERGIKIDQIVL